MVFAKDKQKHTPGAYYNRNILAKKEKEFAKLMRKRWERPNETN